jgi:hypothetical protein
VKRGFGLLLLLKSIVKQLETHQENHFVVIIVIGIFIMDDILVLKALKGEIITNTKTKKQITFQHPKPKYLKNVSS